MPPFLEEGILVSQLSPLGEGAPQGRIGHRRYERQRRKAEQRGTCGGGKKRESLTANDNDWIRVSLKIIRAPSAGRGRRAKRGGVGFPECGRTVSRGQPPPLRGTSFQRKEGEKRGGGLPISQSPSLLSSPAPIHHKAPDRKISDQGLSMRSHQRLSKDLSRS